LSLAYAFATDRKGFPITIESKMKHAKAGLLEDPELSNMRVILGNIHAAKALSGPDQVFAGAAPEKHHPPPSDHASQSAPPVYSGDMGQPIYVPLKAYPVVATQQYY
jgi:hypothetical protein